MPSSPSTGRLAVGSLEVPRGPRSIKGTAAVPSDFCSGPLLQDGLGWMTRATERSRSSKRSAGRRSCDFRCIPALRLLGPIPSRRPRRRPPVRMRLVDGQPSNWGWYGELPPSVLVAAIIRALFLAFLPLGVWLFTRRFKDANSRTKRLPTRAVVGVLVLSGAVNILRQPRWAKGPQRVDPDRSSDSAGSGASVG